MSHKSLESDFKENAVVKRLYRYVIEQIEVSDNKDKLFWLCKVRLRGENKHCANFFCKFDL